MKLFTTLTTAVAATMFAYPAFAQEVDNSPVRELNLTNYLGEWYEIARFDHSFERDIQYAKALYSLMDNGMIRVENTGYRDGKYKASVGKAFLPDSERNPALLRVSFFGPFYSDYRVLMVTDDYQYALVGSKSPSFLWILSRTPQIPHETLESILIEAEDRGYDTDKLTWVEQDSPGVSWN